MRLFIGIKFDEKTMVLIDRIQGMLYNEGVKGNFTNKNNIHLTLSFLGEVNNDKVDVLKKIIDSIDVSKINTIDITGIDVLKDMIILNVNKSVELDNIYNDLVNKLSSNNFNIDKRPYFPHVTLVREKNKDYKKELNIKSKFTKITLFESTRINGVLTYIPLN